MNLVDRARDFALKIHFYVKMKIRDIISNGLELNKCYLEHDPEQHSRSSADRTPCVMLMLVVL